MIFLLFLSGWISASWTSNLNDGLVVYYNMNSTVNTFNPTIYNLTVGEGTPNFVSNGKIGYAGNTSGTDNWHVVEKIPDTTLDMVDGVNYTLHFWVNTTSGVFEQYPIDKGEVVANGYRVQLRMHSDKKANFLSPYGSVLSNSTITQHQYHALGVTIDDQVCLWFDGVKENCVLRNGTSTGNNKNFSISRIDTNALYGNIDEVSFYNRSLSDSEMGQLYNSGDGVTYSPSGASNLTINLNAPENNTLVIAGSNVLFNASVSSTLNDFVNTTIYFNDVINTTYDLTGTLNESIFNLTVDDSIQNWSIEVCNNYPDCSISEVRKIRVQKAIIDNITYVNETIEYSHELFTVNLTTLTDTSLTSANLIYNGIPYFATIDNSNAPNYVVSRNLEIPGVSANSNITFYWNFILTEGVFNTTTNNQTVINFDTDNCSSYSNAIFNFTMYDEELQTLLSDTTMEIATNIYNLNRSTLISNISGSYSSNPVSICINNNLNTDSSIYSVDVVVGYKTPNHANEYYNVINYTLSNSSTLQDIRLYDLNLSDSTEFQLTFTGDDYLPVEGALVYIDRQYISENTFKTVELPLTDSNGQTIIHLVRNDIVYNIRIMKDGVVVGTFNNLVAYCEDYTVGDCKINLNSADSNPDLFNYNDQLGLIFSSPTYDETNNRVTFSYISSDGSSKVVFMNITRDNIVGNRSVCNTTTTGGSGTLICNLPTVQDSNLRVDIYSDGELVLTKAFTLSGTNYGDAGYLVFFVMAISFVLLFSKSKSGILIGILLGFIAGIGFGIIKGSLIGLGASGLWLLIIVIIGLYKLNKDRQQ